MSLTACISSKCWTDFCIHVKRFRRHWGSLDWIGCGSKHGHTSWIGLDWVSEFVDWVGLDLAKWTHVQLYNSALLLSMKLTRSGLLTWTAWRAVRWCVYVARLSRDTGLTMWLGCQRPGSATSWRTSATSSSWRTPVFCPLCLATSRHASFKWV